MHGPATPFVKSDCKHLEAIGDGLELSKGGRGWQVKSLLIYIPSRINPEVWSDNIKGC